MPEARAALVRSNVGQAADPVDAGSGDGQRGRTISAAPVDNQLDATTRGAREDEVHEVSRRSHHGGIAAVRHVAAHLVEKPVHCRPAITLELDPQGGGRGLQADPVGSLVERHRGADPKPRRLHGQCRTLDCRVAVTRDQDRGRGGIGIAERLGRIRVHRTPGFQYGTEQQRC